MKNWHSLEGFLLPSSGREKDTVVGYGLCPCILHLFHMFRIAIWLLYIQVILLMIILQNALGIEETPNFLQRKKMLKEMKVTLYPQPKGSRVDKYYYSHNLKHSHNYNLTINEPYLCSKHNQVFLLILIRTYYSHVVWRNFQRELLNHRSSMHHRKGVIVKHVFMFAKSDDPHIESLIRNESKHHKDIIQEDFLESYFNLIKKVLTAWKWAVNFCPNAEYVMIINDELLLDLDKIISFLLQDYSMGQYDDHFALCWPRYNKTPLFLLFPHYRAMPRESLYRGKLYPSYCHGWGYAAHVKVINKLYKASSTNPPFMPTDSYIGVLSEKLRLKIPDHRELYVIYNVQKYFADPLYLTLPGMIAVTDHDRNKHHEMPIMLSVMKSMRKHWEDRDNSIIHLHVDSGEFPKTHYDDYKFYAVISVLSIFLVYMFSNIICIRLLKACCSRVCTIIK